ncbi:MAG TPA: hypothetical protein VLF59_01610 [Candidatus Saccharimonadales bacterium]|nr:hypothetical protein [Candidatus Saccharimonadales bacterium]
MKNPQTLKIVPLGFLTLGVLVGIVTFFLPISFHATRPLAVHWRAVASTTPIFFLVGAAIIFLGGLKSFKAARAAYRLLAVGMLAFGILLAQASIWGLFNLWDSAWATSGAGIAPLALTAVFIYLAARKFAVLLQIAHPLTRWRIVIPLTAAFGIVIGIFAHYFVRYHIDGADIYIGTVAWGASYMSCAAFLMHKVSRSIGLSYRRPMSWLTVSLGAFSISAWHEAISTLWFNNGSTYTDYGFYLIPWTVSGLITLYASYQFRLITMVARSDEIPLTHATDRDYIDSIITVAGLVSQPEAIEPILDDLRLITATRQSDRSLTSIEKRTLLTVYSRLEAYLTEKDPLRTVTRDELLSRVTPPFRQVLEHN